MNMDWILIDPPSSGNKNCPNVGLAYISGALKEMKQKHRILDFSLGEEDLSLLKESQNFGLSVKWNTVDSSARISKVIRERFPNSRIVWGGPHIWKNQETLKQEYGDLIDEFVNGYYDIDLLQIKGKDISSSVFPIYDKFNNRWQIEDLYRLGVFNYPLITSRGCPFRCTFCSIRKDFLYRTAENCVEELIWAKDRYAFKGFWILDDNFNLIKQRALDFCSLVEPLKLRWGCPSGLRADKFDSDLARAMKAAGCWQVSFGVETTNPDLLRTIRKGETLEQIRNGVEAAKEVGMNISVFLIIGLPGSTYDIDLESYEWAKRLGVNVHAGVFVPIPGTEITEAIKDQVQWDKVGDSLFFEEGKGTPIIAYETQDYTAEERSKMYEICRSTK